MNQERKIISVGWGGHSEPLYRFQDELKLSDHLRTIPTRDQIEAQKGPLKPCAVCQKVHAI